jgi:multiple sugar transport system substrate-binding protein
MAVDDKTMYLDQTDEKYGPLFEGGHVGMIVTGPWSSIPWCKPRLRTP